MKGGDRLSISEILHWEGKNLNQDGAVSQDRKTYQRFLSSLDFITVVIEMSISFGIAYVWEPQAR